MSSLATELVVELADMERCRTGCAELVFLSFEASYGTMIVLKTEMQPFKVVMNMVLLIEVVVGMSNLGSVSNGTDEWYAGCEVVRLKYSCGVVRARWVCFRSFGEPKGIAKSRSGDAGELCQPSAELVGAFMLGGFALARTHGHAAMCGAARCCACCFGRCGGCWCERIARYGISQLGH